MKRHSALQELSREHHSTLSLAQRIIRAVDARDESSIPALTQLVQDFESDLAEHFQKEERSVFPLLASHPELHSVPQEYLDEHKTLLSHSHQVALKPSLETLHTYAVLLKDHTRKEERTLFPLVERSFSDEELLSITTL